MSHQLAVPKEADGLDASHKVSKAIRVSSVLQTTQTAKQPPGSLDLKAEEGARKNVQGFTASANAEFLQDVLDGLSRDQKTLPCKYFYDARGSELFEAICKLDEYYVTRAEKALLADMAPSLRNHLPSPLHIIEPGSGSGEKVRYLIDALDVAAFSPLEISASALEESAKALRQAYPELSIFPVQGDFTNSDTLRKASQQLEARSQQLTRLVFFPGSTIGNFSRDEAIAVLKNLATLMGPEGKLLVGIDLIKNEERLISAYDDSQGITAAFNKNVLHRINRELKSDFKPEQNFMHRAIFNKQLNRIEMHLVAKHSHEATIAERTFYFDQGETIHTENSHKYSHASFAEMALDAGLSELSFWSDQTCDIALILLERA